MKVYIHNRSGSHNEIIESVIHKYDQIIGVAKSKDDEIVLGLHNTPNSKHFSEYITNKYPHIKILGYAEEANLFPFCNDADYYIEVSLYPNSLSKEYRDQNKYFYISHRVRKEFKDFKNVFYLTPLGGERYFYADVLPWSDLTKMSDVPTYIVQGRYQQREWELIKRVLDCEDLKSLPFKIKAIGRKVNSIPFTDDRLTVNQSLRFIEYHKEFLDCYAIIPLVTKEKHPEYYKTQLTSSIHYARAYNLKALLDRDLQNIYELKNAEVYKHHDYFVEAFHKTLKDFYNANKKRPNKDDDNWRYHTKVF